jgi:signal transduction histidine kinase
VNILECERLKNARVDTAGLHYHASVPLCTGGRAMGLMNLAGSESTLFSDDDLKTLYAIGNQVATALARAEAYETLEKKVEERTAALAAEVAERKRAHEEIQRNLGRLRALHEIDLAITSTLDLRSVLNVLLERTSLFFPYDAAVFAQLWDTERGRLERVACRNVTEKRWKDLQLPGGPSLQAFETQSPIVVRNIWRDPRVQDVNFYREHGLISYLGAPIIVKNRILGVLALCTKEEHEFSPSEIDFLVTLAGQAAIAIDNAQLYERTKQQAVDLERANRSRSEFLSVVSHELRTPLTAVVGYTNLIEDGILGEVNEKQKEALATIGQRSQDLHAMINAILQATRIEAGAINVTAEEVPLTAFLDGLRSAHIPPPDKGLTVTWNYPAEMPTITTDSNKLKQILQNLLGNAFKFTEPEGTVTVSARILEESRRNCVEFEVRDDGIGIPTEELPKIFDMFRQVDSSNTRSYGGVGLGLYIAKAFTELLGGTMHVESEPGKGSAFSVRIPTPC